MTARRITITQGEIAIHDDPDVFISTLLGSCVACCLWDSDAKVGGVNHMLLAGRNTHGQLNALVGINELELLINGLINKGAQRHRLVAKVFGGARMIRGLSDIGLENGRFTLQYLEREEIPCLGQSLGGTHARQLQFWPTTGVARQKFVADVAELAPVFRPGGVPGVGNDVEMLCTAPVRRVL